MMRPPLKRQSLKGAVVKMPKAPRVAAPRTHARPLAGGHPTKRRETPQVNGAFFAPWTAATVGALTTARVIARAVVVILMVAVVTSGIATGIASVAPERAFATAPPGADENAVNPHQLPDSSFIYDTSIEDLSQADSYHDNQTVQVVGEVVGDRLNADPSGSHCWIVLAPLQPQTNVNVTVYMSAEDAARIDTYGKYGATGTTLRVRGTFHLACKEHDGLSDIHAEQVSLVSPGKQSLDVLDPAAFIPGAFAMAVGIVLVLVFRFMRERRR